jgi:hypothetical protein
MPRGPSGISGSTAMIYTHVLNRGGLGDRIFTLAEIESARREGRT